MIPPAVLSVSRRACRLCSSLIRCLETAPLSQIKLWFASTKFLANKNPMAPRETTWPGTRSVCKPHPSQASMIPKEMTMPMTSNTPSAFTNSATWSATTSKCPDTTEYTNNTTIGSLEKTPRYSAMNKHTMPCTPRYSVAVQATVAPCSMMPSKLTSNLAAEKAAKELPGVSTKLEQMPLTICTTQEIWPMLPCKLLVILHGCNRAKHLLLPAGLVFHSMHFYPTAQSILNPVRSCSKS